MDTRVDVLDELKYRIQSDIDAFEGKLPERYALAWHGYLAGLLEWGVIDIPSYDELFKLLPSIQEPNPIATIFSGREESS